MANNKKRVELVRQIFQRANSSNRVQWEFINQKGFDFSNDNQLSESERAALEDQGMPTFTINRILPVVEMLNYYATASNPRWQAVGAEGSDADVAAVHIEDQVTQKRCGHRPNKSLVDKVEMGDRIKAAVDGRTDESFFIMARTDSYAAEGMDGVIDRCREYIGAGADGLFLEAVSSLEDYKKLKDALQVPVLANITEFGETPLFTAEELASVGVDIMLFPLSAFRAMNKAAESVYKDIATNGSQKKSVNKMQTRDELYEYLNYHSFEQKLDELFKKKENK